MVHDRTPSFATAPLAKKGIRNLAIVPSQAMPSGTHAASRPRRIQARIEAASMNYGFDSPPSSTTRGKEKNIWKAPVYYWYAALSRAQWIGFMVPSRTSMGDLRGH
jgi:hypothetical protein